MAFNPLVKKIEPARWRVVNFTPARMGEIGQAVTKSVIGRIYAGRDVSDNPALPLKPRYARQKAIKGRRGIRDMTYTGATMASLHVLRATNNQCVIGATGPQEARKLALANWRGNQFGMSPRNMDAFVGAARSKPIVEVIGG
jgi:dihydrodipicolinate reductase